MYRGAIIGLGNIGMNGHLPAYLHPDIWMKKAEIVAGCDLARENLEMFQKTVPSARTYLDVKEMVQKEKLDFIDICTPPKTHFDCISRATNKNLNIMCEKPVTIDLETLFEMKNIVAKNRLTFLPGHQYRYSPTWQKILDLIKAGRIGRPFLLQFFVYRTEANQGNAFWNPTWRRDVELSGGGIVIDHGSHLFYLASSILGKPKYITSRIGRLHHFKYTVEDTAWINIEYENSMSQFSLTWTAKEREMSFRILGTGGEVAAREDEISVYNSGGKKEIIKMKEGLSKDSKHSDWYIPLFHEFFDRLDKKNYSLDGMREAILTTMCISAAYKSAEINKTIALEFSDID